MFPCTRVFFSIQGVLAIFSAADDHTVAEELLAFRVVWKKQVFEISFGAEQRVGKLKEHIQTLTGHS